MKRIRESSPFRLIYYAVKLYFVLLFISSLELNSHLISLLADQSVYSPNFFTFMISIPINKSVLINPLRINYTSTFGRISFKIKTIKLLTHLLINFYTLFQDYSECERSSTNPQFCPTVYNFMADASRK